MEIKSPTPEEILSRINGTKKEHAHGHLKIFFGFAAGVGKTYAMLEAAHKAKRDGYDVVVGYVERHARPETLALLNGLEVMPTKEITYKGVVLQEFDIDRALERKPQLILVDELAHTNASGCRHEKRYQDIEELLRAGIDVYTTVNVQHLESLNDIVTSITGITVNERVPDRIFDLADQVELIDIEPIDLISRLEAGKVYKEGQAKRALQHFFTKENLGALREISLRRTAERLNQNAYKEKSSVLVNAGEHILICLSGAPSNSKVIRTAARMASAFHGKFTALLIETSEVKASSEASQKRLQSNIRLAEQLGAQITTLAGEDLPNMIAEYARISGVTKLVIGRSNHARTILARESLVEKLSNLISDSDIDVYIIPDNQPKYKRKKQYARRVKEHVTMEGILKATAVTMVPTIIGFLFDSMGIREGNIIILYVLGVLATTLWTKGYFYGVFATVESVLAFNFFFTDPRLSFDVYNPNYIITFIIMTIVSILMSSIAVKAHREMQLSTQRAYFTEILLNSNKQLQLGKEPMEILEIGAKQVNDLLCRPILYAQKHDKKALQFFATSEEKGQKLLDTFTIEERAVAYWVIKNNKNAGATTKTFSNCEYLFLSVRGLNDVVGVIGIPVIGYEMMTTMERNLVIALINECGIVMERMALGIDNQQHILESEQERLRSTLLRAISHDLRTPLTGIRGNASVLLENGRKMTDEAKEHMYNDIYDDAMWLVNLTENLLSVTRIENGKVPIHIEAEVVEDVIIEALQHVDRKVEEHHIVTNFDDECLMANMDARLMTQVIINIVNNAIKYTPKGSTITITTKPVDGKVLISIGDNGDGISVEAKEHIFDMFYTGESVTSDQRRGIGLGLYLCQSIIKAHNSQLFISDNEPKGALFYFFLEKAEVEHVAQ